MSADAVRMVVVWCPDWPVTSAVLAGEVAEGAPAAVLAGGQVLACSASARAEGIRRGLRRREAQSRCPDVAVLVHDPDRDARSFEPVVAAVEASCPGVEVLRPGVVAVPARGPARYYGGDTAVAGHLSGRVADACGVPARVGVADGVLAATLAARETTAGEGVAAVTVVPPGRSPQFLAGQPVEMLERPELTDLLRRLGISTLGAFAALSSRDVASRFGADGALAHRLARGRDARPLAARRPPPDLVTATTFDPPVERVDTAAFAARALAGQFHERLTLRGLGCLRLRITARTERGEELTRCWRHEGALSAAAVADRVRWQLDGWLTGSAERPGRAGLPGPATGPTAGIVELSLTPEQVIPHAGQQLGLWGGTGESGERADRSLTHVQGLLGSDGVLTAVVAGGRSAAEQTQLVPWGEPRRPDRDPGQPWPGRLPSPSPATVLAHPQPVTVTDAAGAPVGITGRYTVTGPPARMLTDGASPESAHDVVAWAGPWPVDERWWDHTGRRHARFQLVTADGTARLLTVEHSRWWIEAVYD